MSNPDITTTAPNSAAEPVNSCAASTTSSAFIEFLLAQFRCAALRSKIVTNQIEMATTALSAGLISPEAALLVLHETGLTGLIPTTSAPAIKVSS